jgi:hypothetical protein
MLGDSGQQFDQGQMGSVGDEAWETVGPPAGSSMNKLTLNIVVIVVLTEDVVAEVGMLERMGMSQVTVTAWLELVKLVSGVGRIAN